MGLFGVLKSVASVVEDVVDVAVAPVEITADLLKATTAPIAAAANEVTKEVKKATDEVVEEFK